ncbi:MAG: hypothetical protein GY913_00275 [Proteobacteria bacterium]|nr:hypothetical protein [Pseudomonadota bacterium]MCP4915333.1 hypothetical protein [Pseudomonadota bacterium]
MRSSGSLLFAATVGVALLFTGSLPVTTNDLHIYLVMGRWMAEHGALLEHETITWTAAGTEFVNGTWGFSVASYWLLDAIGLDGLRLLNGLAVSCTVLFVGLAAIARGADRRAAGIAAFVCWTLLLQNTVVRGQTWVFPLFAALLWLAARPRRAALALLAGVIGGAIWAPLHGSFAAGIVGFAALAAAPLVDDKPLRASITPALIAVGLAIGACLGPYGPEIWLYVFDNSALPRERDFLEWYPADPERFEGLRFFLVAGLWCVLASVQDRRRGDLLLVLAFGILALSGTRFIAWFGIAMAPALAMRLSSVMGPDRGNPLARPLSWALGVAGLVFVGRLVQPLEQPLHSETPVDLVAALNGTNKVFNPPEYGGYIAWEHPETKVSGDIRTWLFEDAVWNEYVLVSRAPEDWEARMAEVDGMLLLESFHGETLLPAALASPCWRLAAQSEYGATFVRTTGHASCP